MANKAKETMRTRLVYWLYVAAALHVVIGLALTAMAHLPVFDSYHRIVENALWPDTAPVQARPLQVLWMELFGATLQLVGLWFLALVRVGHRYRRFEIWGWLMLGLLVWAPQDMLISAHSGIWINVVADACALLALLPPLAWLYRRDRAWQSGRPDGIANQAT